MGTRKQSKDSVTIPLDSSAMSHESCSPKGPCAVRQNFSPDKVHSVLSTSGVTGERRFVDLTFKVVVSLCHDLLPPLLEGGHRRRTDMEGSRFTGTHTRNCEGDN